MTVVRVTFTDDTSLPRVITFGGNPLVKWYAYLRSDGDLYLVREENGLLGPETKVIDLTSGTVVSFDMAVDPADSNQAWIYFSDNSGNLSRIGVNSSPPGETPTTQVYP